MKLPLLHRPALLLIAALVLALPAAHAAVFIGRTNVQVGGFFSQGWLYSSDNNFPTTSKGGTWDFREMALNVSLPVGNHVRVGAQAFAQRLGSIGGDKVILDWAVLDYNVRQEFGIRLGRVKYPKGLYGEALDLDIVRPFVFLPNAVYNPVLRDFAASFDGGMIYGTFNTGAGSVDYKLFYGDIPMSPQKGVAEFYNHSGLYSSSGATSLKMDSVRGGQLVWNTPLSGLRLVYSLSQYENLSTDGPFAAFPAANLHSNIETFTWNTVSAEYVWQDWTFAAEWQHSGKAISYHAAPVLPRVDDTVGWTGWYVSVAKRLNAKFEVGAYYGRLDQNYIQNRNDRHEQNDWAASIRYDLNEHILLKAEVHQIEGTYQTFHTPRIPNPTPSTDNTVLAVKTVFSF